MGTIMVILLVVLVISAVLLVLVVLVQDDQGEGIGGIFGGGSNTAFGSRSGNVLTKFTSALAAIFLVCTFGVAWVSRTPTGGDVISKARQQALQKTTTDQSWYAPTTAAPATGATGTSGTSTTGAGTTTPAPATSQGQGGQ